MQDPQLELAVSDYLAERVQSLIRQAADENPQLGENDPLGKPLIRLRVDWTG